MKSVFLLFLVLVWLVACLQIAKALIKRADSSIAKLFIAATTPFLIISPLIDELIGRYEFEALCQKNANNFQILAKDIGGRITEFRSNPKAKLLESAAINIYHHGSEYVDIHTGEVIVRFDWYEAEAGVLAKTLHVFENDKPLIIKPSVCSPEQRRMESVTKTLNFTVTN